MMENILCLSLVCTNIWVAMGISTPRSLIKITGCSVSGLLKIASVNPAMSSARSRKKSSSSTSCQISRAFACEIPFVSSRCNTAVFAEATQVALLDGALSPSCITRFVSKYKLCIKEPFQSVQSFGFVALMSATVSK